MSHRAAPYQQDQPQQQQQQQLQQQQQPKPQQEQTVEEFLDQFDVTLLEGAKLTGNNQTSANNSTGYHYSLFENNLIMGLYSR